MILRLYSNQAAFTDIAFKSGLNVVVGEIRLEEDRDKDTHNLGKSTLCQLINFCLLKKRDKEFFLFKHESMFCEYSFYLEIQLDSNRYLTIRRDVKAASRIWLHIAESQGLDARDLSDEDWTHKELPFDRAKVLVDGLLGYEALYPWGYRKVLAYLLRGQLDFSNVFRPSIFRGKDRVWKPFLLRILGFNWEIFDKRYDLESEIAGLEKEEQRLSGQLAGASDSLGELDALISIKQRVVDEQQAFLDDFKLEPYDSSTVKELVEEVDARIAALNDTQYDLRYSIAQIEKSLEKEKLLFSASEVKKLYDEAGVLFSGQIERSFDQLIAFNTDITEERRSYLSGDLESSKAELKEVKKELEKLDDRRSKLLDRLGNADVISKYKAATNDLVLRKTEIESLRQRRDSIRDLQRLRRQIGAKKSELSSCDAQIQEEVERVSDTETAGIFSRIREDFDSFVNQVIGQHGVLSVNINGAGHAEFFAEILNKDGMSTNQDEGVTYRKLLCVAFDLALLRAHEGMGFPDFVFHDDVFGGLDNRKKENLRDVMRSCAEGGLQQIVTVIDSELPANDFFSAEEVILKLHDDGEDGRLFRLPEW